MYKPSNQKYPSICVPDSDREAERRKVPQLAIRSAECIARCGNNRGERTEAPIYSEPYGSQVLFFSIPEAIDSGSADRLADQRSATGESFSISSVFPFLTISDMTNYNFVTRTG
jgi:hypothetical protein